jgi:hypothetical protein
MPLREEKYKRNQAILKDYGGEIFKLTNLRILRTSGIEDDHHLKRAKGTVNDEKLSVNISRGKAAVMELARCNNWDYFATFTLDPKKYNRTDLERYRKDLSQWLRDQGKKLGRTIKYLLIPELHHDGKSWHMHGFIMGLPDDERREFTLDEKLPIKMRQKLLEGDILYDWDAYREKFGFVSMERIKNREACSKYVTKYISQELEKTITELNAHMYYCSQGLSRATVIKKGTMIAFMEPDYENEYVRVKWFPPSTPVEHLKDMIL